MTMKTIKTILFASLIVAMILPFSIADMADAMSIQHEKNNIKTQPSSHSIPIENDRLKRVNDIYDQDVITSSDQDFIKSEISEMENNLKTWYEKNVDHDMEKLAQEKQHLLLNSNDPLLKSIPITGTGYDYVDNALEISINPIDFDEKNLSQFIIVLRNIVGEDIDLTLSPAPYAKPTCSDRDTFCEDLEGGMEYNADGSLPCSTGFAASYNGEIGFVTAGHCVDGQEEDDVYHPEDDTIIGWVEEESYSASGTISCDCAFIATDDDVVDMSDNIFGTPNPNDSDTVSFGNAITMSGLTSGVETGFVTALFPSVTYTGGPTVTGLVTGSYESDGGDSGAPVIKSNGSDLVGIHVASKESGGMWVESYFQREAVITTEFSGLAWEF